MEKMKARTAKKLIAGLLSSCMIFGMIPQTAMGAKTAVTEQVQLADTLNRASNSLGLKWPENMSGFNEWVRYGENPQAVQDGVISAINEEYNRQKASGYNLGDLFDVTIYNWQGLPAAQFEGGDNVGNPWGQENRKWALIVCPYEGVAVTIKSYMSNSCKDVVPLANQITWKEPGGSEKIYQVFSDCLKFCDTNGTNSKGWGYNPGSGAAGNCADAFDKAYAQSAWYNEAMGEPYHLGTVMSNAKKEGTIVYQEFLGNQSDGRSPDKGYDKDYGISYLVAPNSASTEAFIITDKMFTAWTTTWKSNSERFINSGAPLGNQYKTADGRIAQDFENFTLVLNDDIYKPTILQAKTEISDFTVSDGETIQSGTDIVVFVPGGKQDIKNLTANFKVSSNGSVDKASGTAQDFSNTVKYTVTSQTGKKYEYTVDVVEINEAAITQEQREQADTYINKFKLLNNPVTLGDSETVSYLEKEFWAADDVVKYLVKEQYKTLSGTKNSIAQLEEKEDALKVACVGDSITELSPNYVVPLADLFDSKRVAFNNYGVSGYCLSKAADWSYWTTDKYTKSKDLKPDIVTIMLGTNDSKNRNWNQRNCKDTFKSDLSEMIDIYRNLESRPEIVILASPAVYQSIDTINDSVIKNEINKIQKEVAQGKGCLFVDLYAATANDSSTTRDGVHPSTKGTEIMADAIAKTINSGLIGTELSKITVGGDELEPGQQYYQVGLEAGKAFPAVTVETQSGNTAAVEHQPTEKEPYYIFKVTAKVGNYARKYMVEFVEAGPAKIENVNPNGTLALEAESGILSGAATRTVNAEASNGYHVGSIGGDGSGAVTLTVNAENNWAYQLNIYYSQDDTRSVKVSLNGTEAGVLTGERTGSWTTVGATPMSIELQLMAGTNTITIEGPGNNAYGPNIDKIELIGIGESVVKEYTVTFDSAGGTAIPAQKIKAGELVKKPEDPQKDEYEFEGWYLDGAKYDFATPVDKDITLTALWAIWDETESESETDTKTQLAAAQGAYRTLAGKVENLNKALYTEESLAKMEAAYQAAKAEFELGEHADAAKLKNLADELETAIDNLAFKVEIISYIITFDSAGGTAVPSQEIAKGESVQEPAAPSRDGYTFLGWYAGETLYDFAAPVSQGLVLTAKWQENADKKDHTAVKVSDIKLSGISKRIAAGKRINLTAEVAPANAANKTLIWKSSNETYATVDAKGRVSVKKAGKNKKVTITATAADGSGISAVYTINILPNAVKKIVIKADTKSVTAGKKLKLKAVVTPDLSKKKVNKKLKWSSSNKKYATVTAKGVVKTKKAGKGKKVKITAMATDGSGKKKTVTIKIK